MKAKTTEELWKRLKIKDLHTNEMYMISNFGRIKSLKTSQEGSIMKSPKVKGYKAIVVRLKSEKHTTKYVHKLVAEHFIKKDSPFQRYVIHLDFDKENNHVSNLRWVTQPTMFSHQKINPRYKGRFYSHAKLTEVDVKKIKLLLQQKQNKLKILAEQFGVTHTQIYRIKTGENWAHIKVPRIA